MSSRMPSPDHAELTAARSLLARLRDGNPAAEEEFLGRYRPDVERAVSRVVWHDHSIRDDLVQETLLVLRARGYSRLQQWKGRARLSTFVQIVVQNVARDLLRAPRYRQMDSLEHEPTPDVGGHLSGQAPFRALLGDEVKYALQRCMSGLNARYRNLIQRRYFLDESPADIAAIEEQTPGSVSVALNRALKLLKKCLESSFGQLFSGEVFADHEIF